MCAVPVPADCSVGSSEAASGRTRRDRWDRLDWWGIDSCSRLHQCVVVGGWLREVWLGEEEGLQHTNRNREELGNQQDRLNHFPCGLGQPNYVRDRSGPSEGADDGADTGGGCCSASRITNCGDNGSFTKCVGSSLRNARRRSDQLLIRPFSCFEGFSGRLGCRSAPVFSATAVK